MPSSRRESSATFVAASLFVFLSPAMLISAFPGPARSSQVVGGPPGAGELRKVVAFTVKRSDFQRTTSQPGSVEAFESVNLVPKYSGYLKNLSVDIGDAVKSGQILAELDAPELVAERHRAQAVVEQVNARLVKAKAVVMVAQAVLEAERAKADAVAATVSRSESSLRYREKLLKRLQSLAARKAVENNLADEAESNVEAGKSELAAAKAQASSAQASIQEAMAKLVAARSDVGEVEANLHVVQADLEKAVAFAVSTRMVSPWDGIVTKRGYHVGDYVRSGDVGGTFPLLSLIKTGKVTSGRSCPRRRRALPG